MHDEELIHEEEQGRPNWTMFKRALTYFRGQFGALFGVLGLVVLATLCVLAQPLLFREIFDDAIPSGDVSKLILYACGYMALLAAFGVLSLIQTIWLGTIGIRIVNGLKQDLFAHMLRLGVAYFDHNPVGRLTARVESDCERLVSIFSSVAIQIFSSILLLVGTLVIMFWVDSRLALVAVGLVVVLTGVTVLYFRYLRPMYKQERKLVAAVTAFVNEYTQSARLLQIFGREQWAMDKMKSRNLAKYRFALRIILWQSFFWGPIEVIEVVAVGIALYMGAGWVGAGTVTVGTLVLFIQYVDKVFWPLIAFMEQIAEVQRAFGSAERVFDILDTRPHVPDPADVTVAPRPLLEREIVFEHVSFAYEAEKPVLKDVSFRIPAGSQLALVGPTGGGKTTIISLLCRFYDPQDGRILLDGVDLRDIPQEHLRQLTGLVLQDLYLFPGNVEDNLRIMRSEVNSAQVRKAAAIIGVDRFVDRMPEGFQSELAERGANLSYGERQLLSFARALTFDPKLLILDEATSSVDPKTEMEIQASLEMLLTGRTAVIVAHRLSTILHADQILLVKSGRIHEQGNHADLLAKNGDYARLYRMQLEAGKEAPHA